MLLSNILNILYPRTCPACAGYVTGLADGALCDDCLRRLPRTEQDVLRQNSTEQVLAGINHLERAAAFLFFEKDHPIQTLVHRMKYADRPMIGYRLGRQAAMEMQYAGFFEGVDLIIPVPLHPSRLRTRGYNQAEYIARGIGDALRIPVDTTHVTRVRPTPQQALQTGEDRKRNVADAFAVNHPEQLYHQHILVVDDLITTGETMKSCLHAMQRLRGVKLSAFALCKAR